MLLPRRATMHGRIWIATKAAAQMEQVRRSIVAISDDRKNKLRPEGAARVLLSIGKNSSLDVGLDVVDRLLDGGDLLGFLVGNLALEFLFERHDQLDGVQRVRAQVIHERRVRRDLVFLHPELLDDDLLDAFFDSAHLLCYLPKGIRTAGDARERAPGPKKRRHCSGTAIGSP